MDTCKMTPLYINAERLWKDLHDLSNDRPGQTRPRSHRQSGAGVTRVYPGWLTLRPIWRHEDGS
jgi:hypothetical protein